MTPIQRKHRLDLDRGAYTEIRNRELAPTLKGSNSRILIRTQKTMIASMINDIQLNDASNYGHLDSTLFRLCNISMSCILNEH